MPVAKKRIGGKWRVVEAATGKIATRSGGKPLDGGGHDDEQKALRQVRAINTDLKGK